MQKLVHIRDYLLRSSLNIKPDKLLIFAEKGRVASWRGPMERNADMRVSYTGHVIVTDFSGAPQDLLYLMTVWVEDNCPGYNQQEAVTFHVDIIDHKKADISLAIELSEDIAATTTAQGTQLTPRPDPNVSALTFAKLYPDCR